MSEFAVSLLTIFAIVAALSTPVRAASLPLPNANCVTILKLGSQTES